VRLLVRGDFGLMLQGQANVIEALPTKYRRLLIVVVEVLLNHGDQFSDAIEQAAAKRFLSKIAYFVPRRQPFVSLACELMSCLSALRS
jgi:hypothetical protein